eukprot:GHVS01056371.1.p1 GENE.GHVS01056371.1~~GHVS01056371.1.p1  ORF type:complete len:177 (-),score=47.49 GHVS01056371.1:662-1192(-)
MKSFLPLVSAFCYPRCSFQLTANRRTIITIRQSAGVGEQKQLLTDCVFMPSMRLQRNWFGVRRRDTNNNNRTEQQSAAAAAAPLASLNDSNSLPSPPSHDNNNNKAVTNAGTGGAGCGGGGSFGRQMLCTVVGMFGAFIGISIVFRLIGFGRVDAIHVDKQGRRVDPNTGRPYDQI